MADERIAQFWRAIGGRKQLNGLLAATLLTVMAFPLDASFEAYMTGILLALGITVGFTVTEDVMKARAAGGEG